MSAKIPKQLYTAVQAWLMRGGGDDRCVQCDGPAFGATGAFHRMPGSEAANRDLDTTHLLFNFTPEHICAVDRSSIECPRGVKASQVLKVFIIQGCRHDALSWIPRYTESNPHRALPVYIP
jgi:hypothetical protein